MTLREYTERVMAGLTPREREVLQRRFSRRVAIKKGADGMFAVYKHHELYGIASTVDDARQVAQEAEEDPRHYGRGIVKEEVR